MDPAKMKVVDLRAELGALGLETKGNKPALVERLKKALQAKTGDAVADTTILNTSSDEADEAPTPRSASPASRTTRRRSSSSRNLGTPAKQLRIELTVEKIEESSPEPSQVDSSPETAPRPVSPPRPVAAPVPVPAPEPVPEPTSTVKKAGDDDWEDSSHSPTTTRDEDHPQQQEDTPKENQKGEEEKMDHDGSDEKDTEKADPAMKTDALAESLTEEEEWKILNERLKVKEQQRIERERKQAEEDAKRLEELSNDPVKLRRLNRKRVKKARWSNFYRAVEVTNEVLTPPTPEDIFKNKQRKATGTELNVHIEPELDDDQVTLSWYDSDLNQCLALPELHAVVPLSEGAFAHAWAGVRATHGVVAGRVCVEVRVGAVVTTTETSEKEGGGSLAGLRMGWSTDDSTLHLGEGERSWGFESSGRAVHNGEFKEYGKKLEEKDVVGVYLDLESRPCTISYTINGEQQGVAYEFDKSALGGRPLFPHVLTKNTCYRVNLGHDRYNMLTRTKIVRNRVEVPVEQVLEEKRRREVELMQAKQEAERLEHEKKEKDRRDREERQRKKKQEKERIEREKKEKEAEERRARGEPEPEEPEKKDDDAIVENGEKDGQQAVEGATKIKQEVKEEVKQEEKHQEGADGEPTEVTEDQVLTGHVLDERIKFVIRYTIDEELEGVEAALLEGYQLLARADLVPGPRRPPTLADCEVILMVGMPGAGKTYWARQHCAAHPHKRYNVISTGALFDQMKVDCKPLRDGFEGRWDAMVTKCAKSVLKVLELARGRRRNYILDQTNVYPSAQRRKLREFEGYRRVAVVVVPTEEQYNERRTQREAAHGKEVPDPAVVDMKANITLPEKGVFLDDVIYAELDKEAAEKVIEKFHAEAKAAGVVKQKEQKERKERGTSRGGGGGGGGQAHRQRSSERRRDERRPPPPRDFPRDRDRRGGGGGGGSRWGPAGRGGGGGGGGRFGGSGGGGGRFDRWGQNGGGGPRSDFGGRDGGRDGFRDGGRDGYRGGRGGGRGERGAGRGERGLGPARPPQRQGPPSLFDKPRNNGQAFGAPPVPGAAAGASAGGGWQRGGGGGGNNQMQRGANRPPAPVPGPPATKDGQQTPQANPQGWNQWAGGWGGWNQNPGWANWGGNWANWNQQQQGGAAATQPAQAGQAAQAGQPAQAGQAAQAGQGAQAWGANYTAQQWYQWQQWQQQQQGWPGYQQGQQQASAANPQAAAQAWAQYYQNYGGAQAANAAVTQGADKK